MGQDLSDKWPYFFSTTTDNVTFTRDCIKLGMFKLTAL
jgi:hypothetical protein